MKLFDVNENTIFRNYSKTIVVLLGFSFSLVISFIKYLTGPEWAMSAFYIFPIILVAWNAGIAAGIVISFFSAITWLFADLMLLDYFSNPIIPFLNETFRMVVFLVIIFIIFKLKTALENQQKLAGTDPLTSVLNRRAFYDLAGLELNSARRYQTPTSFLYLDVDNFKGINDHFGHRIGDALLCSVVKEIQNNTRAIDVIVRFGGDEFGILFANTGAESAGKVVEKLKDALSDLVRDKGWPVTFSIGLATFIKAPEKIDEMIDVADTQMYYAKQEGKNQIRHKIIVEKNQKYGPLETVS